MLHFFFEKVSEEDALQCIQEIVWTLWFIKISLSKHALNQIWLNMCAKKGLLSIIKDAEEHVLRTLFLINI